MERARFLLKETPIRRTKRIEFLRLVHWRFPRLCFRSRESAGAGQHILILLGKGVEIFLARFSVPGDKLTNFVFLRWVISIPLYAVGQRRD